MKIVTIAITLKAGIIVLGRWINSLRGIAIYIYILAVIRFYTNMINVLGWFGIYIITILDGRHRQLIQ